MLAHWFKHHFSLVTENPDSGVPNVPNPLCECSSPSLFPHHSSLRRRRSGDIDRSAAAVESRCPAPCAKFVSPLYELAIHIIELMYKDTDKNHDA